MEMALLGNKYPFENGVLGLIDIYDTVLNVLSVANAPPNASLKMFKSWISTIGHRYISSNGLVSLKQLSQTSFTTFAA